MPTDVEKTVAFLDVVALAREQGSRFDEKEAFYLALRAVVFAGFLAATVATRRHSDQANLQRQKLFNWIKAPPVGYG